MERDLFVYSSTDPAVLASWEAMVAAENDWQQRVQSMKERLAAAIGDGVDRQACSQSGGFSHDRQMVGLEAIGKVPEGWRKVGYSHITPMKKTKAGKALAAEIAAVRMDDPRKVVPGMPSWLLVGFRTGVPGYKIRSDGAMWCTWSLDPADKVDTDLWTQRKRSEYYALLEAESSEV